MYLMVIDYENYGIPNAEYLQFVVRCFEDNDIIYVSGKVDLTSHIDFIDLSATWVSTRETYERQGKRIHNLKSRKTIC
ncbi:hypothetical protein Bca4012_027795 [Brassica carinata]